MGNRITGFIRNNIEKLKTTSQNGIYTMATASLVFASTFGMAIPTVSEASSHNADTTDVVFTASELTNNWGADRRFPSGGVESVNAFGRDNVAQLNIDSSDTASGGFQRTEGIKTSEVQNLGDSVEVDLYLDSSWEDSAIRAGLWVAGDDGDGNRDGNFAIIDFIKSDNCEDCTSHVDNAPDKVFEGFRIWESGSAWTEYLDTNFEYDTWVTLGITLDTDAQKYTYYVNGEAVGTANGGEHFIREVFLNSYNYGLDEFENLDSDNYQAHWHGMTLSRTIPTGDVEISAYFCVEGTSVSWSANGPGGSVPDECVPAQGLNFSNVEETGKAPGDASGPWLREPTHQTVSTDSNGVAILEDLSSEHRHGIISENVDDSIIFYACEDDSSSGGNPTDQYEFAFPVSNQAKQCVAYYSDETRPSIEITNLEEDDVIPGDFVVEGNASDAKSDIDRVVVSARAIENIGGSTVPGGSWMHVSDNAYNGDGTFSMSIESLNLDTGLYRIQARAYDNVGNDRQQRIDVLVDDTRPSLNITNLSHGDVIPNDFVVEGTASDAHSDVERVRIQVREMDGPDGDNVQPGSWMVAGDADYNEVTETFSGSISSLELSTGYYRIEARAWDTAGNDRQQRIWVLVDDTDPVLDLDLDREYVNNDDEINLEGSVDGTGSPVESVEYRILRFPYLGSSYSTVQDWNDVSGISGDEEHEDIDQLLDLSGVATSSHPFRVEVIVTDAAGNTTGLTGNDALTFYIDRHAPNFLNLNAPGSGESYTSPQPINGQVRDSLIPYVSGTESVLVEYKSEDTNGSIDDCVMNPFSVFGVTLFWNFDCGEWNPGADGIYDITVSITDNAGNSTKVLREEVEYTLTSTLGASMIVCDSVDLLPNWAVSDAPSTIGANTAADWVAENPGCELAEGWNFQWGTQNAGYSGGDFVGEDDNFTTFGPTDENGYTEVEVPISDLNRIETRVALQEDYLDFSDTENPGNPEESAEFYCHDDIAHYDNWEWIQNPEADATYNCVAWSVAPVEEIDENDDGEVLDSTDENGSESNGTEENGDTTPSLLGVNQEFLLAQQIPTATGTTQEDDEEATEEDREEGETLSTATENGNGDDDGEVAAETDENLLNWWWVLLLLILAITGWMYYRSRTNKQEA